MRKPTFCICENKDADQLRGRPNMIRLKELMQTNNERILLTLAIFTEKAFKIRTELYTNS